MKKYFISMCISMLIFNSTIVFGNDEISVLEAEPTNSYTLSVNNECFEKSNIIITADWSSTNVYVSLRGFVEKFGGSISWNNETKSINLEFNGIHYEIINTDEKADVKNILSFVNVRYAKIKNIDTNEYVQGQYEEVIPIYTMNNISYINYVEFCKLAKNAGCDPDFDISEKTLTIKKYNYSADYITSNIEKNMTYSKVIGSLGESDYFELLNEGGCKIRYCVGENYVEIIFSPYSEESDMQLVSANVIDRNGNLINEIDL